MAVTAKVGRRGQITLPKEVRDRLSVEEGHHVAFVLTEEGVTLRPLTRSLRSLRGSVPVSEPQDFDAVRGRVKQARSEDAAARE